MDRIVKISHLLRILFWCVLVIMPLGTAISWILLPQTIHLGGSIFGLSYSPIPMGITTAIITPGIKAMGFLLDMGLVLPNMLLLYFLIRLFNHYQRQQIFSLENVRLIRNVGWTLIVWQLLTPIHEALLSLVLTWHNAPGQHVLEASFGSNNIAVILIALIVILISWVMAVGLKLQEEQDYTV